ncbi:MAG: hypothetical protein ABFD94_11060 [Armatimonadia bacterium]
MTDFKIWRCKKRWSRMRPTISTTRGPDIEWLKPYAGIGMDYEGRFDYRINRIIDRRNRDTGGRHG